MWKQSYLVYLMPSESIVIDFNSYSFVLWVVRLLNYNINPNVNTNVLYILIFEFRTIAGI